MNCPDGFFCFDNSTILIIILFIIMIVVYLIQTNNNRFAEIKKSLFLTKSLFDNKINQLNGEENDMIRDIEYQNLKDISRITNPLEPPERSYPYRINSRGIAVNYPTRGLPSGYQQVGILIQEVPSHNNFFSSSFNFNPFNVHTVEKKNNEQPVIPKPESKPISTQINTPPQPEKVSEPVTPQANPIPEKPAEEEPKKDEQIEEGFMNFVNDNNKKMLPLFGQETYSGSNKWNYYTMNDTGFGVKLPVSYKNRQCQDEYGCQEIYDGDSVQISGLSGTYKAQIYKLDGPRYIPFL